MLTYEVRTSMVLFYFLLVLVVGLLAFTMMVHHVDQLDRLIHRAPGILGPTTSNPFQTTRIGLMEAQGLRANGINAEWVM